MSEKDKPLTDIDGLRLALTEACAEVDRARKERDYWKQAAADAERQTVIDRVRIDTLKWCIEVRAKR